MTVPDRKRQQTEDAANTSSRTLRLLSLLQGQRYWPGAELADRLEVSVRTLRRDAERLRELGYPVQAHRGGGSTAATSSHQGQRCRPGSHLERRGRDGGVIGPGADQGRAGDAPSAGVGRWTRCGTPGGSRSQGADTTSMWLPLATGCSSRSSRNVRQSALLRLPCMATPANRHVGGLASATAE